MNFIQRIFGNKEQTTDITLKEQTPSQSPIVIERNSWLYHQMLAKIDSLVHPSVVDNNFLKMFETIPEVFWPIDYIAKRISEAHFDLKRVKDDSIVWCNRIKDRKSVV